MKAFRAAAVLVLLAGPAYAQMQTPNINLLADQPSKTPEQIEQEQARDKAYKESLKKIPDAKTSNDPWGSVRSDAPKSAPAKTVSSATAAKPKSATAAKSKTESKTESKTGGNTPN
jgi:hypothetical protein